MVIYTTPDGRRWLYGGHRPVGLTDDLYDRLDHHNRDVGDLTWEQHSQLWAGAIIDLDALADALARRLGTDPTAEQIAALVRALLTHPG